MLPYFPFRTLYQSSGKGETEDDERSLLATVIEGALEQLGSLIDGGRVAREEAIQSYTYLFLLPFSHLGSFFSAFLGTFSRPLRL